MTFLNQLWKSLNAFVKSLSIKKVFETNSEILFDGLLLVFRDIWHLIVNFTFDLCETLCACWVESGVENAKECVSKSVTTESELLLDDNVSQCVKFRCDCICLLSERIDKVVSNVKRFLSPNIRRWDVNSISEVALRELLTITASHLRKMSVVF